MADAEQVEAGLLFLVLELDPEHLSLADLTQRMSERSSRARESEASSIHRAATSLEQAGLLRETAAGRIAPTRAALRFNALYI